MFERDAAKKLESRRREALSAIRGAQISIDVMTQRPRRAEDPFDSVHQWLVEIEQKAQQASNVEDLDDLIDDPEEQVEPEQLAGQTAGVGIP